MESLRGFDLGLGHPLEFSASRQRVYKDWLSHAPRYVMAADTDIMRSLSRRLVLLQLVSTPLVIVTLYVSMDRQLTPRVTQSFVAQCDAVTSGLVASLDPYLAAGDVTTARLAIEKVLSIPDVEWAYITAPNGKLLADTFVRQFPDDLKRPIPMVNGYAWIRLAGERMPALVVRKHVPAGTGGAVWVGFSPAPLVFSTRVMERAILFRIILVMLAATLIFDAVLRRMMASEVCEQRETLEARVHTRTKTLSRTNTALETEITEHERAELALRQKGELVMLLLESAPEAI
jgi:hypothetical protein